MGRSHIAPEAFNCSAPDTGNMETVARYATEEQQARWAAALAGRQDPLGLCHDRARRGLVAMPPTSKPASCVTATNT